MVARDLNDKGYNKEEEYFKKLEREQIEKMKKKKEESGQQPESGGK